MSFAHWTCQPCLLKESNWPGWYHFRYKGDFCTYIIYYSNLIVPQTRASFIAQWVKNLPALQETWVWFLGQEDPPEKEMTIHSSILAWKISWTEEPGRLQSLGSQRVRHNLAIKQLEWVAISFSRGSSWPRGWSLVSCIAGRFFTVWAIREVPTTTTQM